MRSSAGGNGATAGSERRRVQAVGTEAPAPAFSDASVLSARGKQESAAAHSELDALPVCARDAADHARHAGHELPCRPHSGAALGNHRVRRISATVAVNVASPMYATTTLAGTGALGSTDGLGVSVAAFNQARAKNDGSYQSHKA